LKIPPVKYEKDSLTAFFQDSPSKVSWHLKIKPLSILMKEGMMG